MKKKISKISFQKSNSAEKQEIKNRKKGKVVVAMSGGVDSSVAAALLKKDNYEVIGVFMKIWQPRRKAVEKTGLSGNRCCSLENEKRARLVAAELNIPFYVFNFEKEFKKKVVDYFLKEEKAGRTPNPCVVCNKEIKFGLLLKTALKLGANYIATGHYVRLCREAAGPLFVGRAGKSRVLNYKLFKAKDKNKDQSYFLWQLNQKQLKHILFPIGDYTKDEIKELAKKFNLSVFDAPESQEVCFIGANIKDFLKKYLKIKKGLILEKTIDNQKKIIASEMPGLFQTNKYSRILKNMKMFKGYRVLGVHNGLAFYTIGQRKGIKLGGGPYWVLDKDIKRNILIVTKNEKDLYKKELIAKNINWISGKTPNLPLRARVQIRYRHRPVLAEIKQQKGGKLKIIFSKPQRAVTPGQSVVFYQNQELLGGGTIC